MFERLTAEEVKAETIKKLGFDPGNDFKSKSVLAASLRRAAGLLCPCPRQDLIRSVIKPLEHIDIENVFSEYIDSPEVRRLLDQLEREKNELKDCENQIKELQKKIEQNKISVNKWRKKKRWVPGRIQNEEYRLKLELPELMEAYSKRQRKIDTLETDISRKRQENRAGVSDDQVKLKKLAEDTLDDLITYGDVFEDLELADASGLNRPLRQIYRTSPCFLKRPNGSILIIGIPPDGVSPLSGVSNDQVKPVRCIRILENKTEEIDLIQKLKNFWGPELPEKQWLKKPPKKFTAQKLLDSINEVLDESVPSPGVEGLSILDPTLPVGYYNGRWTPPKPRHDGRYIGKRPKRYGGNIFCFVEIIKGKPFRLIDFPLNKIFGSTGCDQAWWIQMAIDHNKEEPQFVTTKGEVISFHSPIPSWAQRRLEVFGEQINSTGSLFSYILPAKELDTELKFIKEFLWLKVKLNRPGSSLEEIGQRVDALNERLGEN